MGEDQTPKSLSRILARRSGEGDVVVDLDGEALELGFGSEAWRDAAFIQNACRESEILNEHLTIAHLRIRQISELANSGEMIEGRQFRELADITAHNEQTGAVKNRRNWDLSPDRAMAPVLQYRASSSGCVLLVQGNSGIHRASAGQDAAWLFQQVAAETNSHEPKREIMGILEYALNAVAAISPHAGAEHAAELAGRATAMALAEMEVYNAVHPKQPVAVPQNPNRPELGVSM